MIDLSGCKNYSEALEQIAKVINYGECSPKIIIHDSRIIGIEIKFGDMMIKWKKKNE